jgi:hypothetical protein
MSNQFMARFGFDWQVKSLVRAVVGSKYVNALERQRQSREEWFAVSHLLAPPLSIAHCPTAHRLW